MKSVETIRDTLISLAERYGNARVSSCYEKLSPPKLLDKIARTLDELEEAIRRDRTDV